MSDYYSDNEVKAMRRQTRSGGALLMTIGLVLGFAAGFLWFLLAGLGLLFVLSSHTPDN